MAYSPKSRRELLLPSPEGQITLVNHGEQVTPPVPNRGMAAIAAGVDALFGWRFANASLSISQGVTFTNTGGSSMSSVDLSAQIVATIVLWAPDGTTSTPITLTVMNGTWDIDAIVMVRLPATGSVTVNNATVSPSLIRFNTAAAAADWLNSREFNEATRYFPLWIKRGTHVDFLNGIVRVPIQGSVTNQLESQYALDETFDDLTNRVYQQDNGLVTESGDATFSAADNELSWSVASHLLTYILPGRRVYEIEIPSDTMVADRYLAVSIDREIAENTTVSVTAEIIVPGDLPTANESILLLGYWDGEIWSSRWGVVFSVPSYAVPARFLPLTGQGIGQVGFLSTDFIGRFNKITATYPTGFSTVYPRILADGSTPETAFTDAASGVEAATVVARRAVACRETTPWGTAWPPVTAKALRVVSVDANPAALESQYVSASVAVYTPDVKYGTTGISMSSTLADHTDRIGDIEVEIASQAERLGDAEVAITDLQGRTSDLEDAVSALDGRLDTAEADIDLLQIQNVISAMYSPYQTEYNLSTLTPTNFGLFPRKTVFTYSPNQSVAAGSNTDIRQSGNVYATATDGQYLYVLHIRSLSSRLTKHPLNWDAAPAPLADVTASFDSSGKVILVASSNRVFVCDNTRVREYNASSLSYLSNEWSSILILENAFMCERWLCVVHRDTTDVFVQALGSSSSQVNTPVDIDQTPAFQQVDVLAAYALAGSVLGLFTAAPTAGVASCTHGPYIFVSISGSLGADYGILTFTIKATSGGLFYQSASFYQDANTDLAPKASCCDGKKIYVSTREIGGDQTGHIIEMNVSFNATVFNPEAYIYFYSGSGIGPNLYSYFGPSWAEYEQLDGLSAIAISANEKEVTVVFPTRLVSFNRATKEFTVARSFSSPLPTIRSFTPYWGGWILGVEGISLSPATQDTVLRVRPGFDARDVVHSEATELYKSPYNHLLLPRF